MYLLKAFNFVSITFFYIIVHGKSVKNNFQIRYGIIIEDVLYFVTTNKKRSNIMKNIKKTLAVVACLSIILSFVFPAIHTPDNGVSTYSDEKGEPITKQ